MTVGVIMLMRPKVFAPCVNDCGCDYVDVTEGVVQTAPCRMTVGVSELLRPKYYSTASNEKQVIISHVRLMPGSFW